MYFLQLKETDFNLCISFGRSCAETILGNEAKLKNMSFITTKVDIVGSLSESGKTVSQGYDEKNLSDITL